MHPVIIIVGTIIMLGLGASALTIRDYFKERSASKAWENEHKHLLDED